MLKTVDAYKIFLSLKIHFTRENYDYFHMKGGVNHYDINTVKNKETFARLTRRFTRKDVYEEYCVGNIMYGGNLAIMEFEDDPVQYYKKNKGSLYYNLSEDMDAIIQSVKISDKRFEDLFNTDEKLGVPPLYTMTRQEHIRLETLLVLDALTPFLNTWNEELKDIRFEWPEFYLRARKYAPFLKINKPKSRRIVADKLKEW